VLSISAMREGALGVPELSVEVRWKWSADIGVEENVTIGVWINGILLLRRYEAGCLQVRTSAKQSGTTEEQV